MSPAWIQVSERLYMDGDRYAAFFEVGASYGVPKEVFVHAFLDDSFSFVATADALDRWPATREEAAAGDGRFYRKATAARSFATRELLTRFTDYTRQRLRELVDAWNARADLDLPAESVYVVGEET